MAAMMPSSFYGAGDQHWWQSWMIIAMSFDDGAGDQQCSGGKLPLLLPYRCGRTCI